MKIPMILALTGAFFCASAAHAGLTRELAPRQGHNSGTIFSQLEKLDTPKSKIKKVRKADGDASSMEGTWTFLIADYYFPNSIQDGFETTFNATVSDDGMVTFVPANKDYYMVKAQYDAEESTLVFSKMYLQTIDTQAGTKYVYQCPFQYDERQQKPVEVDYIEAQYNADLGAIVFDTDTGILWGQYSDMAGRKWDGWIDGFDYLVATLPAPGDWKEIGNATLMDGWLLPALNVDQTTNKYEVAMQQNSLNENLFRLVNPYKIGPAASLNSCSTDGYIMFDITDPAHVIFRLIPSGFSNADAQISLLYCYDNFSALVYLNASYPLDELLDYFGNTIPYTTYKDGIVSLNTVGNQPDTRVGFQFAPLAGGFWEGNMTSQITFPEGFTGVEAIGTDKEDGHVEYFNLQGLPVANPLPGQLLIKRNGSKASKVIL